MPVVDFTETPVDETVAPHQAKRGLQRLSLSQPGLSFLSFTKNRYDVHISIKKTIFTLSSITLFLIATGWMTQYYAYLYKPLEFQTKDCHGFIRLFFLDGEANLPAWYQSMTLLACAILLSLASKAEVDASLSKWWKTLAAIFLLLSADEAACMHEGVSSQLYSMFHTSGLLLYAWVLPGALFVLIFFLWSSRFLGHLPRSTRVRLVVAGALYVSGAIGWEMIGAWYDTHYGAHNVTLMTLNAFEETFECAGVILFIRAMLLHLQSRLGREHSAGSISNRSNGERLGFARVMIEK